MLNIRDTTLKKSVEKDMFGKLEATDAAHISEICFKSELR
jgi:hypothetical protein